MRFWRRTRELHEERKNQNTAIIAFTENARPVPPSASSAALARMVTPKE